MKNLRNQQASSHVRVIYSLPKAVEADVRAYAGICRAGNKSAFVADAIRLYVSHLHKARHTAKLRQAYAASAEHGRALAKEWEQWDEETWSKLDALQAQARKAE